MGGKIKKKKKKECIASQHIAKMLEKKKRNKGKIKNMEMC